MNKILIMSFIFLVLILEINIICSLEYKKEFVDTGKYGEITINKCDGFFNTLGCNLGLTNGVEVVKYYLDYNTDQCLYDCQAIGRAVLSSQEVIFEKVYFKDYSLKEKSLKSYKIFIEDYYNVTTTTVKSKTLICNTITTELNNKSNVCTESLEYETKTEQLNYWKEYKKELLNPGVYKWKLEARREKLEAIDWVLYFNDIPLNNWAWWNTSWERRVNVTIRNPHNIKHDNEYIEINITGVTSTIGNYSKELVVLNNNSVKIEKEIIINGSNWATIAFLVNATANQNQTYQVYYSNPLANEVDAKLLLFRSDFETGTIGNVPTDWGYVDPCIKVKNTPMFPSYFNSSKYVGDSSCSFAAHEINHNFSTTEIKDYYTVCGTMNLSYNSDANTVIYLQGGDATQNNILITKFVQTANDIEWFNSTAYVHTGYDHNYAATRICMSGYNLSRMNIYVRGAPAKMNVPTYKNTGDGFDRIRLLLDRGIGDLDDVKIHRGLTYENNHSTYSLGTEEFSGTILLTANSPANNYKTSAASVAFNCTAIYTDIKNLSVWTDSGVYGYHATITNSTPYQNLSLYYSFDMEEGIYSWYCDSYPYAGSGTSTAVRLLYIDRTAPTISITYPTAAPILNRPSISVNFTAADAIANLNDCGYSIDGAANKSLFSTCNGQATVTSADYFNTTNIKHSLTFYANDSVNNFKTSNISFYVYNYSVGFTNSIIEGEEQLINFTLYTTDLSGISANITYDNSYYNFSYLGYNGSAYRFSRSFNTPVVASNLQKNFSISYTLNNAYSYNTNNHSLTVINIPALVVNASCSPAALRFNLVDEQTLAGITGEFEYNFYYGLSNSTLIQTYGNISNVSSFTVCINDTISPSWTLGAGEIHYRNVSNYVDRRYYLFSGTNLTTTTTNITLHDLLNTQQTSFKLEVESSSLDPYENVLTALLRWYPNLNEYRIVDMGKTDETGSTVIHVKTEDVDYRIGVYELNGTLIKLADPIRMVCLVSPCTYTLKIAPGDVDYTSFLNIAYSLTFNETIGIWTFTYTDVSLKTNTMNLTVWKLTSTSDYVICSNQATGVSGVITCNTSMYTGTLKAEARREASPKVVLVQKIVTVGTNAFKSGFGLWLALLIAIPIIIMFAMVSPIAAIFGGIIALIPALYFGSINISIFGGLIVLGGIVAHFLKRVG